MNRPPFLKASVTNTLLQLVAAMATPSVSPSGQLGVAPFQNKEVLNLAYQNVYNPNSTVVFLQFFDAASTGAVTLGTTAPLASFAIPPSSSGSSGLLSESYPSDCRLSFKLGVVVAVTSTQAGNGSPGSVCQLMAQFI